MKILHTSDVHLVERENPHFKERWDALERIIELSKVEGVDVIVISGDLFDSSNAASSLRADGEIRGVFESINRAIIIIPGNHDRDAFREGSFYGKNIVTLDDSNPVAVIKDVEFWGIPYSDRYKNPAQVGLKIREIASGVKNPERAVLLIHGELVDVSGDWSSYGDEGRETYFPFKLRFFSGDEIEGGWRYILAGHFHSNFNVLKIVGKDNLERFFVYPGSPVSITEKERGKRKVNIFKIGDIPASRNLKTLYYEQINIEISPFDGDSPVEIVKRKIGKFVEEMEIGENGALLVEVRGFYNGSDEGLSEDRLIPKLREVVSGIRGAKRSEINLMNVEGILNDSVYEMFEDRLNRLGIDDPDKKKIREFVIRAMIEVYNKQRYGKI